MKVRRHTSSGIKWSQITVWLNPRTWFAGSSSETNDGTPAQTDATASAGTVPASDQTQRSSKPGPSTGGGKASTQKTSGPKPIYPRLRAKHAGMKMTEAWLFGGALIGSIVAGYLIAAIFFFPAPFFSSDETVPRVIELPVEEAQAMLEAAGLVPGEPRRESHPSYPAGHIAWQDPPQGVRVPPGTIVRLAVSRGPQEIPIPDVSRYESDIASQLITRSGLTVRRLDSIQTALPKGVAVGSRPAAGATLAPGSGVILIVSRGAPTISVPDLAGLTLAEATEELTLLGLSMGRSWQEFSNAQPEGIIFRQEPPAGTLIAPGTPINVVIARTP